MTVPTGLTGVPSTAGRPRLDPFFRRRLAEFDRAGGDVPSAFLSPAGSWEPPASVRIQELTAAGPRGDVPLRTYRVPGTDADTERPALVWMHGGGFVAGSLEWGEAHGVCAELAARSGALVVSVDYRLVTDHVRYPLPLDDVDTAWAWLLAVTAGAGREARLLLGGASAGANLAIATALRLRDRGGRTPDGLLLAYGAFHHPSPAPDEDLAGSLASLPPGLLNRETFDNDCFRSYTGPAEPAPGYARPGHADLAGLPPTTVISAEIDDLRPSSDLLARQLADAGVPVTRYLARGMLHGHLNWFPGPALPEVDRTIDVLATALSAAPARRPAPV